MPTTTQQPATEHPAAAESDRACRRRPGGRSARVRSAVLRATIAELLRTGYAGLSVEAVAKRAGVHKTTVYRRWGTPQQLVTDALLAHMSAKVPPPDTGMLRSDLVALTSAIATNLTSPESAALLKTMVASGTYLPEVRQAGGQFWTFALAGELIRRGINRGELPEGTDPDLVIEALIAPLYLRLLVLDWPIDAAYAERIVDLVLDGAVTGSP
jgi:AcrR family transcriptional regulator